MLGLYKLHVGAAWRVLPLPRRSRLLTPTGRYPVRGININIGCTVHQPKTSTRDGAADCSRLKADALYYSGVLEYHSGILECYSGGGPPIHCTNLDYIPARYRSTICHVGFAA